MPVSTVAMTGTANTGILQLAHIPVFIVQNRGTFK